MGFYNSLDPQLLLGISLVVLGLYFLFFYIARRRQFAIIQKSLKLQEQANQQLGLMLQELKRSNRALAALADIELEDTEQSSGSGSGDVTSQVKLYVGNIDYAASEADLADHFARCGRVEFVNIPINRYNGRTRGFGFVTFASHQDAERAMSLNGSEFRGRQIQVNFAKERDQ